MLAMVVVVAGCEVVVVDDDGAVVVAGVTADGGDVDVGGVGGVWCVGVAVVMKMRMVPVYACVCGAAVSSW